MTCRIVVERQIQRRVVSTNRGAIGPVGPVGPGVAPGGNTGQHLVKQSPAPFDTVWADANFDPAGSAAAVQANLNAHIADNTNPHGVTAAQAGADALGSADAVQGNLTNHIASLGNHDDVNFTSPQFGDVPLFEGTYWLNARVLPAGNGFVADNSVPFSAGPYAEYIEFVPPSSSIPQPLINLTYDDLTGRFRLNHGFPGFRFQTTPTLIMSCTFPTANTLVEAAFGINGVIGPSAGFVKGQVGNAGQQTTDTSGTLALSFPNLVEDGNEISVFLRANSAFVINSFLFGAATVPEIPFAVVSPPRAAKS